MVLGRCLVVGYLDPQEILPPLNFQKAATWAVHPPGCGVLLISRTKCIGAGAHGRMRTDFQTNRTCLTDPSQADG